MEKVVEVLESSHANSQCSNGGKDLESEVSIKKYSKGRKGVEVEP